MTGKSLLARVIRPRLRNPLNAPAEFVRPACIQRLGLAIVAAWATASCAGCEHYAQARYLARLQPGATLEEVGLTAGARSYHTQRWHAHRHSAGSGHLYQGRFKSFPVQTDHHFLVVCRYVERNPLRANLVDKAQDWRWSSLWRRRDGTPQEKALLGDWPLDRPSDWLTIVNRPQSKAEEAAVLASLQRSRPFGSEPWTARMVTRLGLQWTVRPRGRPRIHPPAQRRELTGKDL